MSVERFTEDHEDAIQLVLMEFKPSSLQDIHDLPELVLRYYLQMRHGQADRQEANMLFDQKKTPAADASDRLRALFEELRLQNKRRSKPQSQAFGEIGGVPVR